MVLLDVARESRSLSDARVSIFRSAFTFDPKEEDELSAAAFSLFWQSGQYNKKRMRHNNGFLSHRARNFHFERRACVQLNNV